MSVTAVYPGTFDPITYGHLDIIQRALTFTDHLIIGVAEDTSKSPMFSLEERKALVMQEVGALEGVAGRVEARSFSGLLVNFAEEMGARMIIRGLRAVADFEFEFQMACMNNNLKPGLETVFLMASERHQFIASRLVKEVCRLGGDVSHLVPPGVLAKLTEYYAG